MNTSYRPRPLSVMCKILHGVAHKNIVIIKLCGLEGLFFYPGFTEGDLSQYHKATIMQM